MTPTMLVLTATEQQKTAEVELTCQRGQHALVDQACPELRELSFTRCGLRGEDISTDQQTQDRIAQKLQTLIIAIAARDLMGVGTVGQGLIEQRDVSERVPQTGLENCQEGCTVRGDHDDSV